MNPDARLRNALAPVDPPDGFAQRVRARVARDAAPMPAPARSRVSRWMAIAAMVTAVLASPLAYREYESRREALAARAQILLALRAIERWRRAPARTGPPPSPWRGAGPRERRRHAAEPAPRA